MPSHGSLASVSSANLSLGPDPAAGAAAAGGSAGGGGYDPLAAMMAPPARRIPSIASYANMAPAAPAADLDPLAAMMAPPSIGRYSQVTGGGHAPSGAAAAAPPVNMWRPPAGGSSQFMQVPTPAGGAPPVFQSVSLSLSDNDAINLEYPPASSLDGPPPSSQ